MTLLLSICTPLSYFPPPALYNYHFIVSILGHHSSPYLSRSVILQKNVPDSTCFLFRLGGQDKLHCFIGHCDNGQQTISLRLPSIFLAGGRKGRSGTQQQAVLASRLAIFRRTTSEADHHLRKSQVDQHGSQQARICQYELRLNTWKIAFFLITCSEILIITLQFQILKVLGI
jgi:hypothetical protein